MSCKPCKLAGLVCNIQCTQLDTWTLQRTGPTGSGPVQLVAAAVISRISWWQIREKFFHIVSYFLGFLRMAGFSFSTSPHGMATTAAQWAKCPKKVALIPQAIWKLLNF